MRTQQPNTNDAAKAERLEVLLERHAAALQLYARQFCQSSEDVVQDAIIELASCQQTPHDDVAWLYGAVRRKAISAARRAWCRKRHETQAAASKAAWFHDLAEQSLDAQTAASVLLGLPNEEREVIVAHIWGGLTFMQIGNLMGTSDSTAHRRYRAGLAAIRRKLKVS